MKTTDGPGRVPRRWSSSIIRTVSMVVAVALGSPSMTGPAHAGPPPAGKGAFAFHYAWELSEAELAWLTGFRVVVLARAPSAAFGERLRRAGVSVFLYEWLTGFYLDSHSPPWERSVVASRPSWVLNPKGPVAGPDNSGRAYYYDPAAAGLAAARAEDVSRRLDAGSMSGVFFDLVGRPSIPAPLLQVYAARHGETFDAALADHVRALRTTRPATRIFTNQGYRIPDAYLPIADYDLSESLMTTTEGAPEIEAVVEGRGLVRTRETLYRSWDAVRAILAHVDAAVRRHNAALRLFHLNYVAPRLEPTGRTQQVGGKPRPVFRETTDRAAIYYAYAVAKLWGHDSFSALPEVRPVRDEVYFADLGEPLGESWEARDGVVLRHYTRGIVVVNPSPHARTIRLESPLLAGDVHDLWDCYSGRAVGGRTVTVPPTVSAVSRRSSPAGRVYLHLR